MTPYDPRTMVLKLVGEALGIGGSVAAWVLGATEPAPLTYGALGATLVFTGLLVRQITTNQRVYIAIVAAKDRELAMKDWQHRRDRWDDGERINEARWETEKLRYTYGERPIDPGPYMPRPRPADLDTPPTFTGATPG